MSYELYDYDPSLPPILMKTIPLGFGGGPVIEKNYVIGSVIYTDVNFGRVENLKDSVYVPDPNWKMYPKHMYPSIFGILPIDTGITTYEADKNHYIYYQPNSDISRNYSRMLRAVFENKIKRKKIEPILTSEEKKELLKNKKKILKSTEEQLMKLKSEVSRDKNNYERIKRAERGKEPSRENMFYEQKYRQGEKTVEVLNKNIASLKKEIEEFKK